MASLPPTNPPTLSPRFEGIHTTPTPHLNFAIAIATTIAKLASRFHQSLLSPTIRGDTCRALQRCRSCYIWAGELAMLAMPAMLAMLAMLQRLRLQPVGALAFGIIGNNLMASSR